MHHLIGHQFEHATTEGRVRARIDGWPRNDLHLQNGRHDRNECIRDFRWRRIPQLFAWELADPASNDVLNDGRDADEPSAGCAGCERRVTQL